MNATQYHRPWIVVHAGDECCDAAKSIDGSIILVWQLPEFPLTDCNKSMCKCVLQQLTDEERSKL